MKIAILAPFNPSIISKRFEDDSVSKININGSASSVNNLVVSLLEAGQQVSIITLDPSCKVDRVFRGDNINVYLIGNQQRYKILELVPRLSYLSRKIADKLGSIINEVEVVHAHWAYEYANACLPYTNEKPIVCTYRDWPTAIISNLSRTPFLYYLVKRLLWFQRVKMSNNILNCKKIHLIANSDYINSCLTKSVSDSSRINIIYNSFNDDIILQKPKLDVKDISFVTIAASLDNKLKNILNLVLAFEIFNKEYPNTRLILIGPYHKERRLYEYVDSHHLTEKIVFRGALSHEEVINCIDESFCLVHPSKEESFGNTLIEGMARCKPVIGGVNSGAVPYVLDFGTCGYLCDVNDPINMAITMVKVIENESTRKKIIENASVRLLNNFANSICVTRHLELYKKLICN